VREALALFATHGDAQKAAMMQDVSDEINNELAHRRLQFN
jgi:hypothetical protein